MYRVLIIDDDITTIMSLKTMINWEQYDFSVVAEADNGKNGIDAIKLHKPDLVITDMNMPIMDGIKVIEWVKENEPSIFVLALSGYDDFDYVKSSLKNGVIDYLLKHTLDDKQLVDSLELIKNKIFQQEINEEQKKNALAHELNKQLLRQSEFLRQLLLEPAESNDKNSRELSQLGLPNRLVNNVLIIIELDNLRQDSSTFDENYNRKFTETFSAIVHNITADNTKAYPVIINASQIVIIYTFGSPYSTLLSYNMIHHTIERIQMTLKRQMNLTACYAVSGFFKDHSTMNREYMTTNKFFLNRLYEGKNNVFMNSKVEMVTNQLISLSLEQERKLSAAIEAGNISLALEGVSAIFDHMYETRNSLKSVQMIVSEIIRLCSVTANKYKIDLIDIYKSKEAPYQILAGFSTLEDIKIWTLEVIKNLSGKVNELIPESQYSEVIVKAMIYIQRNYQNDISLGDVSSEVGLSSSHLSRLFKEECSTNYIKYLNELRIERAKVMIEEGNVKLKDLVKDVGFRNYNYFFKVFKDYTGLTPQAYEKQIN